MAIGLNNMLKKVTRRLQLLNALVFILVLSVFALAAYLTVTHNLDSDIHKRLEVVTDALVSSVEAPEHDDSGDLVPDVVKDRSIENQSMALQWFDAKGSLQAAKSSVAITVPFDQKANFQLQTRPHFLLLTRPIKRDGGLIGYLRVGLSLAEADSYRRNLVVGLFAGTAIALTISALAIIWLVRQALEPVENSMRALKEFTADASHELKSPVMAIKANGAVALKYSEGMRDSDRENIGMMLDAANQISRTIADLLSLAECESEQKRAAGASPPLNVEVLVNEVGEDLREIALSKNIEITCMVASALFLNASKTDIKLVLDNLCKNAIAYSPAGSSIMIKANKVGNKIQFEIIDRGIGISEEEIPKIFERFWRSDKARSYTSSGNGLGLAIVKAIVERYDGAIVISSKLGEGTSAVVTFPQN